MCLFQIMKGMEPNAIILSPNGAVLNPAVGGDGWQRASRVNAPGHGHVFTRSEDMEIVNKVARKGIWPDNPIRKQAAFAGSQILHFAVEIEDADGNWHLASQKGKLLSPDYLLVNNAELREMAEAVAQRIGYGWTPRQEYFDGTRYKYFLTSDDLKLEVAQGDAVRLGIYARQAYDGSQRASVQVYAERLVCHNGMIVKDELFDFTFRHRTADAQDWQAELDRASYQLRNLSVNFERFVGKLARLREIPIGNTELVGFTERIGGGFPVSTYGEIMRRFFTHEEATAFGLLNACTYVTWHRGETVTEQDFKRNEDLVALCTGPFFLN